MFPVIPTPLTPLVPLEPLTPFSTVPRPNSRMRVALFICIALLFASYYFADRVYIPGTKRSQWHVTVTSCVCIGNTVPCLLAGQDSGCAILLWCHNWHDACVVPFWLGIALVRLALFMPPVHTVESLMECPDGVLRWPICPLECWCPFRPGPIRIALPWILDGSRMPLPPGG